MKRWRTDGARRIFVATAFAFLAAAVVVGWPKAAGAESKASVQPGFSREKLQRVGDYIRNEIVSGKIPGAVVLIQQHGKPVYFENFGMRDVETKVPMTADTIFRLYSMTKPITSVAAMMLVDDGKLSLDDPVSKYIPDFADLKVGVEKPGETPALVLEPLQRPITIKDLLRHTSGLTYGFYGDSAVRKLYAQADLFNGDADNAEFARRIAALPLAEQPGTLWDYGHSTDVLGRVIEVASGKQLFAFEQERLLGPLGMTDTAFWVADAAQRPRLAEPLPHDRFTSPIAGIRDLMTPRRWQSGGAGMVGTIGDYARFAQMLLNGGTFEGQALPQARDRRPDDLGPYRAGNEHRPRPLLFSGRHQRFWARLRRAYRAAAEHVMAAGRISLGRRRRHFLLYRSEGRYVRDLHDAVAVAARTDSTGIEGADL